ncbi:MAG: VOC family protein [Terricaulis sp.]
MLCKPPCLVPEFDVSALDRSMVFYTTTLGFSIAFQRAEERFAYLCREGAHLMLQEANGPGRRFRTAELQFPFGRGLNLQIEVSDVIELYHAVTRAELSPVIELEERWYRQAEIERGARQFVVADPDGYLLRFYSALGTRSVRERPGNIRSRH